MTFTRFITPRRKVHTRWFLCRNMGSSGFRRASLCCARTRHPAPREQPRNGRTISLSIDNGLKEAKLKEKTVNLYF